MRSGDSDCGPEGRGFESLGHPTLHCSSGPVSRLRRGQLDHLIMQLGPRWVRPDGGPGHIRHRQDARWRPQSARRGLQGKRAEDLTMMLVRPSVPAQGRPTGGRGGRPRLA